MILLYGMCALTPIEGWFLLDRELNRTHTIKWDATDKTYELTPIEGA